MQGQSTRRRWWWIQISLRGLLLAMLLAAVYTGGYMAGWRSSQQAIEQDAGQVNPIDALVYNRLQQAGLVWQLDPNACVTRSTSMFVDLRGPFCQGEGAADTLLIRENIEAGVFCDRIDGDATPPASR